jgi:hypothetical protein
MEFEGVRGHNFVFQPSVVAAWPGMPEAIRADILARVKAASGTAK